MHLVGGEKDHSAQWDYASISDAHEPLQCQRPSYSISLVQPDLDILLRQINCENKYLFTYLHPSLIIYPPAETPVAFKPRLIF